MTDECTGSGSDSGAARPAVQHLLRGPAGPGAALRAAAPHRCLASGRGDRTASAAPAAIGRLLTPAGVGDGGAEGVAGRAVGVLSVPRELWNQPTHVSLGESATLAPRVECRLDRFAGGINRAADETVHAKNAGWLHAGHECLMV